MNKSEKFHLNSEDVKRWGKNTLIFSTPAIIAGLIALQTNSDPKIAIGAMYQALIAAAIDLLRKFLADSGKGGDA